MIGFIFFTVITKAFYCSVVDSDRSFEPTDYSLDAKNLLRRKQSKISVVEPNFNSKSTKRETRLLKISKIKINVDALLSEKNTYNKKLKKPTLAFIQGNTFLIGQAQLLVEIIEIVNKVIKRKFNRIDFENLQSENNLRIFFNLAQLYFLSLIEENSIGEISKVEEWVADFFVKLAAFFRESTVLRTLAFTVLKTGSKKNIWKRVSFSDLFLKTGHIFSLHSSMLGFLIETKENESIIDLLTNDNYFFANVFQILESLFANNIFSFRCGEQEARFANLFQALNKMLYSVQNEFFNIRNVFWVNNDNLNSIETF